MNYFGNDTILTQCLIHGVKTKYDACGSESLEHTKALYGDAYRYIGSSHTYFINGTLNRAKELHHFFVRANDRT